VKDRVFEGGSVTGALEAASVGLGLPVERLRYVVLEEGSEATTQAPGTSARIVVFLDATQGGAAPSSPAPSRPPQVGARRVAGDAKPRLRRLVEAVAEAAGEPLDVVFEDGDETLVVRISGPGEGLLLEQGGVALRALEHVLQRAVSRDEPRRLQLTSTRFRSERDVYLRARARELADAVRTDGVPRETEPLNSYDRRIVHLAVQEEPKVRSFSVGEGSARRVTVAPEAEAPAGTPETQ
jgi:spoIIIJ-associated protein